MISWILKKLICIIVLSTVYTEETKGSVSDDKSLESYTRRKRCNTDPSLSFMAVADGTVWCRDQNYEDDDTDGYLIMKPVYEEKLKRFQSRKFSSPVLQGVPQSPLHSSDKISFVQSKLKRSATVSGEVSALSVRPNQRTMSLRERPARVTGTPPRDQKSSMNFMERFLRKRGGSESMVKVDMSRPRHKHNYASIDPGDVVRQSRQAITQARMQSTGASTEVDILDNPEFNASVSKYIQENHPSLEENYSSSSSAPSSMQYNQLEASIRASSSGHDSGIQFTADVDTVVFSHDRKTDSSDEYLNLWQVLTVVNFLRICHTCEIEVRRSMEVWKLFHGFEVGIFTHWWRGCLLWGEIISACDQNMHSPLRLFNRMFLHIIPKLYQTFEAIMHKISFFPSFGCGFFYKKIPPLKCWWQSVTAKMCTFWNWFQRIHSTSALMTSTLPSRILVIIFILLWKIYRLKL